MNKWVKRSLNLTAFCIAFNALEHFCHKKTEGFSLSRIQFHHEPPSYSTEKPDPAVLTLLNQPFHYLDCGNQCFAFASEDGEYVLKFFKYVDHAPPAWMTKIPLLNHFKLLRPHKLKKTAWKRERDFQGYQLAFDQFRSETGLLSVHLHPTVNIYPTISLRDKLHIAHRLDLNATPFILQKRAVPIYSQFSAWLEKGDIEKVRRGIESLISLCAQRISKQIYDDDVHFYSNFGFVGESPIQVDPGHFTKTSSPPRASELQSLTVELSDWFAQNYPPLAPYVEACAAAR